MSRTSISLLLALLVAPPVASGEERCGPAEDPERWPDWGGTPDIAVADETGLSAEEVGRLLEELGSPDHAARRSAVVDLGRYAAGSETIYREALWGRHGARNAEMKGAVREARRRAERAGSEAGGLLHALLEIGPDHPEHGVGARAAARVLALLEALDGLGTMAAFKVMLEFSPRHAGVFRQDIGAMIVAHNFEALPALVYGRGSKDKELHMFSVKWIRDLGNPLLGEQVIKLKNPRRLAQLLEAYASVNDLDTIDVTLSLTNHGSAWVRRAARCSLRHYGVNAKWKVRRQYENTFGREPAEDAAVEAMLTELYRHYDDRRLATVSRLFDDGQAAWKAGRFDEMAARWGELLRQEPAYAGRRHMAAGYLSAAEALASGERGEEALGYLRLALRVAEPGSEEERVADARLRFARAEAMRAGHVVDVELYGQAAAGDPELTAAARWAGVLVGRDTPTGALAARTAMVSLVLFLAAVLVYLRLRG